jgi:hypothetical protein
MVVDCWFSLSLYRPLIFKFFMPRLLDFMEQGWCPFVLVASSPNIALPPLNDAPPPLNDARTTTLQRTTHETPSDE